MFRQPEMYLRLENVPTTIDSHYTVKVCYKVFELAQKLNER